MKKAIAAAYAGFPIGVRDWVPPAEMPSFLAQAHVGLLPLIPDGTNDDWMRCKCPTKLFEFMAMEMPTVASAYGEVRGIISDGEDGLLAGDRNEFIERMRLLAGDAELRARMGKRARESAVSRYSLHGQRDILRDIVRSVAERHESVGPVVGGKA
jgi:glycosyltransferase involved in cell wall biosynthesis